MSWAQNVAKIGSTEYATLQAAVDDAYTTTGDVTIELIANTSEAVVVKKKVGLNLTIDGKDKTLTGQIIVAGTGSTTSTEVLTIIHLKFAYDNSLMEAGDGFIIFPDTRTSGTRWYTGGYSYAHNVNVSYCDFVGNGVTGSGAKPVGVHIGSIGGGMGNFNIDHCTASGMHSLAQFTNVNDISITNCTLTEDMYHGVSISGGTGNFIIENNTMDIDDDYGIRIKGGTVKSVTLSGNNVEAPNAIVLNGNATGTTVAITSGTYIGGFATDASDITITGGTYSSDVTPECAPGYAAYANGTVPETWTVGPMPKVAKIGSVEYTSLQAALDSAHANMTGDVTIELLKNITEVAIVHQKASLNLTIEGSNDTIVGQIAIDGDGRASGTETLTIQNVRFVGQKTDFYTTTADDNAFVLVPNTKTAGKPWYTNKYNYAHNITLDNCVFSSTAPGYEEVAVRVNSGAGAYNVTINNCKGDSLHSLAQFTGTTGATITNDTVTKSESFINVSGGAGTFNVSNCKFTTDAAIATGYAVRENGESTAVINLDNNEFIKGGDVLVMGKGSSVTKGTINVTSGFYEGNISKTSAATGTFVFTGGTFSEPKATVDSWCAPGYYAIENDPDALHCTVYQMYSLIYNANGGTGTMDTIYVRVDASVSDRTKDVADCAFLPALTTDVFAIWNTKADSTGISFNPGDPIVLISDTTLYAIWREGYSISYNANGGTGTIPPQIKLIGVDVTLSDGTDGAGNYLITKTDSTLYRWNTTPDEAVGSTNYALGETYSTNASLALYAVWRLTLDMTMDSTDVVCYGENNGTDTVKIIGGEAPYMIVLSSTVLPQNDTVKNLMDTEYIFENLKPGKYNVELSDVLKKDFITGTFTIAQPDTLEITALTVPTNNPCPLMGVGSFDASVTAQGGNDPGNYTYAWGDDATNVNAAATEVPAIADDIDYTYTVSVTVTDIKACTATATATIEVSPVIVHIDSLHGNTTMKIDTVKQGIMQGCDTIIRDFGYPTFTFTNSAITEDILDTVYNDIPTNYPDSIFSIGYNPIIWTAVDTCGHEVTCEQIIYIYHYPCPSVDDGEGNTYNGVRVGCLCWTDRNLVSTKYSSNGNTIPNLMSYVSENFPNATENVANFGYLYDWYAAVDTATNSIADIEATYAAGKHVQGACPNGWYLPTDEDLKTLESFNAKDLRSTDFWIEGSGTNSTGFNAVPGGYYNCVTGRYENAAGNAYFWSCHPVYDAATGAMIDYICEKIYNGKEYSRCNGFSIRCVLIVNE